MNAPDHDVSAPSPIELLTPRRRELLGLLAKGLTNDEIATALGITPGTVRSHVTTLLAELDVANRTEAAAAYVAWRSRPDQVAAIMRRPAIAVLPLVPIGEDPQARNAAAGLTEDLASLFARWCWFPVIATCSSNGARSLGTTSREVGERLGARFLVDGSLRVTRGISRLSVHVDDTESGHRIWSEQRDYRTEGVFEAQDAVCQAVVAAAYPVLMARVQAALTHRTRPARDLTAWELAHQGLALRAARDPAANESALRLLQEALLREPTLVLAHYGVGLASYDALLNQWGSARNARELLHASSARCLDYAPHGAEGYFLLGRFLQSRGDWEQSIEPLEMAVGKNPSFALAHAALAQSLQISSRSDEALVRMRHAVKLGPGSFVAMLSTLHFMRGEYLQALESAERAVMSNPRYPFAQAVAAASAWWMKDEARGRAHLMALRATAPNFRPTGLAAIFGERREPVERLTRALEGLSGARSARI